MEQYFGSLTCCWLNVVLLMAQLVASVCTGCLPLGVQLSYMPLYSMLYICLLHISVGMGEYSNLLKVCYVGAP